MNIVLPLVGGTPRLESWEHRAWSPGVEAGPRATDRRDAYTRAVAQERPGPPDPHGPFRRVADSLLAYRIFPPTLVSGVLRRTPVEVGDTVGVVYHGFRIVKLFFAARVIERFDEPRGSLWSAGFTYRTLERHPELGEETFSVEKDMETGVVTAALRSWSRPGILLTRLCGPLTRWVQVHASRAALDYLAQVAQTTRSCSSV